MPAEVQDLGRVQAKVSGQVPNSGSGDWNKLDVRQRHIAILLLQLLLREPDALPDVSLFGVQTQVLFFWIGGEKQYLEILTSGTPACSQNSWTFRHQQMDRRSFSEDEKRSCCGFLAAREMSGR